MVAKNIAIIWDNIAIINLTAIYNYYYPLSIKSANKVRDEILDSVSQLKDFPESGIVDDSLEARYVVVWHWRVYYRYSDNEVRILKIFDMRQNPEKLAL